MEYLGWTIAIVLVIAGLAGTILPALPGTILVFAGLFVGAWVDHFTRVGVPLLVVLGFLSLLSYILEIAAAGFGVKVANASRQALIGAAAGTIVGLFMGFIGLLWMPFVGAFVGEWIARRDLKQAGIAGFATWLGLLFGTAARLALAFLMIGIFIVGFFWPHHP